MIVACAVLAVLLIMLILSMLLSFPDTDESDLMGQTEADSAVSEISAGLLVRSEDVLSTALSYVETYYATTPSDKRSELAARRFTELFYEEMRTMAGVKANAAEETVGSTADKLHRVRIPKSETAEDSDEGVQTFAEYLQSLTTKSRHAAVSAGDSGMYIACSDTGQYVELQNLKVSCSDGSDKTVDLRFSAPKSAAEASASSYAGAINAYAVVADGDVVSIGGRNRINGSAYSGGSIKALVGGVFDFSGNTTIARGDLMSSGSAMLNVLQGEVWASNLRTVNNGASGNSYSSGLNMDLQANCFISGDLVLDNPGYAVNIDGNYYGYGTTEDPYEGSVVNQDAENSLTGTEMDSILQRLLSGSYTILTNEDGTTTTIISDEARAAAEAEAARIASEAAMSAVGSTIRINGSGASTLIAFNPKQVLWLASTGYYGIAPAEGRSSITASNVPNGMGSGSKDTGAANLETLYTYQYNGLKTGLDKNASTGDPSYQFVQHLLEISGLSGKNMIYTDNGQGKYEGRELEPIRGSSGNYIAIQPKSDNRAGVLIADCDVRLANTEFNGIIITTGNVILSGGVSINTDQAEARFTGVAQNLEKKADQDSSRGRVTVKIMKPSISASKDSGKQDKNKETGTGNEKADKDTRDPAGGSTDA